MRVCAAKCHWLVILVASLHNLWPPSEFTHNCTSSIISLCAPLRPSRFTWLGLTCEEQMLIRIMSIDIYNVRTNTRILTKRQLVENINVYILISWKNFSFPPEKNTHFAPVYCICLFSSYCYSFILVSLSLTSYNLHSHPFDGDIFIVLYLFLLCFVLIWANI